MRIVSSLVDVIEGSKVTLSPEKCYDYVSMSCGLAKEEDVPTRAVNEHFWLVTTS